MKLLKHIAQTLAIAAIVSLFVTTAMASSMSNMVKAGFTGLPLRDGYGTYCAVIRPLKMDEQLRVLYNDTGMGWSYVEVVGTHEKGWVCNQNVF